MARFPLPLVVAALCLGVGCDGTTPASDPEPTADSSTLLQGSWLRIDTHQLGVQTMRLDPDRRGWISLWESGLTTFRSRFSWSTDELFRREVDSSWLRLPPSTWRLRGDTLFLCRGRGPQTWIRSPGAESSAVALSLRESSVGGAPDGSDSAAGICVATGLDSTVEGEWAYRDSADDYWAKLDLEARGGFLLNDLFVREYRGHPDLESIPLLSGRWRTRGRWLVFADSSSSTFPCEAGIPFRRSGNVLWLGPLEFTGLDNDR